MGIENKELPEKVWRKNMVEKFLQWRVNNNYSGIISTPEVAHFTQEIMEETKKIVQEELGK